MMKPSRLALALENGALELPAQGQIAVFGPRADHDLSMLPKSRLEIIQGFAPDHDFWAACGYRTQVAARGPYAAAVIFLPRAKPEAHMLVAEAVARTPAGLIIVDGQKTDGIDSLYKSCRQRMKGPEALSETLPESLSEPLAKAHGKLFWFAARPAFDDWAGDGRQTLAPGFETVAGVFSAGRIDAGSQALAAALPAHLPARVADLGAGWGYLSRAALTRAGVKQLHLIEASHAALECARRNIPDPRARFHWADVRGFHPEAPFDMVLSNPPFHSGRAADAALGRAFITAAAAMLKPSGQLWLVANRHLPYEATLAAQFSHVGEKAGNTRFKIFLASHPKSASRKRR